MTKEKKKGIFDEEIENDGSILCDYGCGSLANYRFGNGKYCCKDHWSKCENKIKNLVSFHTGKKRHIKSVIKMRKAQRKRSEKIKLTKEKIKAEEIIDLTGKICSYCNEREAKVYFNRVKKFCCETHLSKCPSQKKRLDVQNVGIPLFPDESVLCDYGCGQLAKFKFKNCNCCSERPQSCPVIIKKNSDANKIKSAGENNGRWLGGISRLPYGPEWDDKLKSYIKERDNYKCMNPDCWKTSKILNIHHIDYDKMNCKEYNLITLCNSCNSRANGKRDEWEKLYKKIIKEIYEKENT